MSSIAKALERAGYKVFLPHRDGLELAKILPVLRNQKLSAEDASAIVNRAIFSLDVFEIMDSHGIVVNMNGRVPDEGAMVEAGIAWSHGKALVIFNSDTRSLVQGNCNPLLLGLSNFEYVAEYERLSSVFDRKFVEMKHNGLANSSSLFDDAQTKGKAIRDSLLSKRSSSELALLLVNLFGEVICQTSEDQKTNCSPVRTRA